MTTHGPPSITAKNAAAILRKDTGNLVKKVKAGKPLTASERLHLQKLTAGLPETDPGFARNQVELAKILNVDRKTVRGWIKEAGSPQTRPDGRYEVAAWRVFKGTRRAGSRDDELDPTSEKARQTKLQNEKLETQVEIMRQEWIRREEVEADTSRLVLAAKSVLLSLPAALAPQVVGLPLVDVERLIMDAINDALRILQSDPLALDEADEEQPPQNDISP